MARDKKLEYSATPHDVLRMVTAFRADSAKVGDIMIAFADFILNGTEPEGLDPIQQAICENWINYATRKKDNFQKAIDRYEQKKQAAEVEDKTSDDICAIGGVNYRTSMSIKELSGYRAP